MTTTVSSCQRPAQPLLRRGSFPRSLRHHRQSCTAVVQFVIVVVVVVVVVVVIIARRHDLAPEPTQVVASAVHDKLLADGRVCQWQMWTSFSLSWRTVNVYIVCWLMACALEDNIFWIRSKVNARRLRSLVTHSLTVSSALLR